MHVQIVRFHLEDMTEAEYAKTCDELAPAFAAVPGLESKVWLADASTGTYGGVYLWRDRAAMESYAKSDLCEAVMNHPNLADISSIDFAVMAAPTRVTRGWAAAK